MRIFVAALVAILSIAPLRAKDCTPGTGCTGVITSTAATCTLSACVQTALPHGTGSGIVTITGAMTATLQFEASADYGTTWAAITGVPRPSGTSATSATAAGVFDFNLANRTNFRVRCSAYTSGRPNVTITFSKVASTVVDLASGVTGTLPLANGGTNATSFTASRCVRSNAGGTALEVFSTDCLTMPRLDQILDPTANKTFDMGTNVVNFTTTSHSAVMGVGSVAATESALFEINSHNDNANISLALNVFSDNNDTNGAVQAAAFETKELFPNASGFTGNKAVDIQFRKVGGDAIDIQSLNLGYLADSGGTTSVGRSLHIDSPLISDVTVKFSAVELEDVTGAITNYAIKTGLGQNSFGDRLTVKSNTAAIQSITFTGAGLNDATSGGTYTGLNDLAYCVQIDASVPSPDTFEWGTGGSCSNGATGVGITGAAQNLSLGVQVTFAAIDGHTIGDNWTFTAYAPIPLTLQDSSGNITFKVEETGAVRLGNITFANRGTVVPGKMFYCPDCDPSTVTGVANECTSAGAKTGAVVTGTNAKWACMSVN